MNSISSINDASNSSIRPDLIATATLIKLGIGAGVVVLPATFAKTGLIVGIIATIIIGILSYFSGVFIANGKQKTKLNTYEDVCQTLLGPVGYWALIIGLWILLFLVTSAYVTLIKEFIEPLFKVLKKEDLVQKQWFGHVSIGVVAGMIFPMLFLRKLEFLKFSNILGIVSIVCLFILSLIASALFAQEAAFPALRWWPAEGVRFLDILEILGGVISAFCFHHGICSSMDLVPKDTNFKPVIRNSTIAVGIVNLILGVYVSVFLLGHLDNVGDKTYLHVFRNEGAASIMIGIASVLQAISVLCSLPLIHFIWRELSWSMWKRVSKNDDENIPNWFFFGHTLMWLLGVGISFLPVSMAFLINFIGLSTTTLFVFILPASIQMELDGGISHILTFGFIKSKYDKIEETIDIENKQKKKPSIGFKILKSAICHSLFWFGLLEFGLSFKVLIDAVKKAIK